MSGRWEIIDVPGEPNGMTRRLRLSPNLCSLKHLRNAAASGTLYPPNECPTITNGPFFTRSI
jgi:hypothetical protein